jgi:hypothetical protein
LSLALWDSIPDEELFEAARDGQLATQEQIKAQARRMIDDPRAQAKMRGFFNHWLELEERDLSKDKNMFPEYDESVVADLRYSLDLFVDRVVWSEQSDYRQLLLADYLYLNEPLRDLYHRQRTGSGQPNERPAGENSVDFEPYVFHSSRRAGVLTHPYLLSAFAYHNNTSPIHRGVFLTRNIIGRGLKPPPIAVAFKDSDFPQDITMREKITQLTRDQACMSCHSVINPLGFALENYDAVGRWRTQDQDNPLNTRSDYMTEEGQTLKVQNARDIANFAAVNESAHRAFVTQIFHHLLKQDPFAYGKETADRLRLLFAENRFSIQNLMIEIAVFAADYQPQS